MASLAFTLTDGRDSQLRVTPREVGDFGLGCLAE